MPQNAKQKPLLDDEAFVDAFAQIDEVEFAGEHEHVRARVDASPSRAAPEPGESEDIAALADLESAAEELETDASLADSDDAVAETAPGPELAPDIDASAEALDPQDHPAQGETSDHNDGPADAQPADSAVDGEPSEMCDADGAADSSEAADQPDSIDGELSAPDDVNTGRDLDELGGEEGELGIGDLTPEGDERETPAAESAQEAAPEASEEPESADEGEYSIDDSASDELVEPAESDEQRAHSHLDDFPIDVDDGDAELLQALESITEDEAPREAATDKSAGVVNGGPGNNSLVDEGEVDAMLQSLESMSAEEAASIPDFGDADGDDQGASPVAAQSEPTDAAGASRKPAGIGLKLKIGKDAAGAVAGSHGQTDAAPAGDRGAVPAVPHTGLHKRLMRLADRALEAMDRWTRWVPERLQRLIGVVALVTIVVSLVARYTFPLLFRGPDAVEYLRDAVRAVETAQAEEVQPEPEDEPDAGS